MSPLYTLPIINPTLTTIIASFWLRSSPTTKANIITTDKLIIKSTVTALQGCFEPFFCGGLVYSNRRDKYGMSTLQAQLTTLSQTTISGWLSLLPLAMMWQSLVDTACEGFSLVNSIKVGHGLHPMLGSWFLGSHASASAFSLLSPQNISRLPRDRFRMLSAFRSRWKRPRGWMTFFLKALL